MQGNHEQLFTKFWDLSSFDIQNSYLFGCIRAKNKKRSYKKKQKNNVSRRKFTADYLVNIGDEEIKICKTEFLSVHGLQKSRGRVERILKMKVGGAMVPKPDMRGKHNTRPNRYSDEQIHSVKTHIESIPKYQSHYSRAKNIDKLYLNCDMTITGLYTDFYMPWCREQNISPVKESAYRKIFCTQYNIGFKLPKSDTCKTCDEMGIKIKAAKEANNIELEKELTTFLNLHQARADAMQKLLKSEIDTPAKKKLVISFDLQQSMPLPKLTTGPAFYCRKIWLYNLGIHDCTNKKGFMYLWTEDQAKRGADEVASVLMKFLETKLDYDELVIFTDNCPGQNKNWQMMAFWLQLVKEKKFRKITHHFLLSGHSVMPSDRDFALIKKRQRHRAPVIYSPEGWLDIIEKANKKNPFVVTKMTQKDFFSFEPLLANINKKARFPDKQNLEFAGTYSFLFKSENVGSFFVKSTVNGEYREINVLKQGRPAMTSLSDLKLKYNESVKIAEKKIKNIQTLLPYIPPAYHAFYTQLNVAVDNLDEEIETLDE